MTHIIQSEIDRALNALERIADALDHLAALKAAPAALAATNPGPAAQPDGDGWIAWRQPRKAPGEHVTGKPVPPLHAQVDVKFDNGEEELAGAQAGGYRWDNIEGWRNISAYRIHTDTTK